MVLHDGEPVDITSEHDLSLSARAHTRNGRRVRGCPRGGLRLVSADSHPLQYKAHYSEDSAQMLVASAPAGVVVVGAYFAPSITLTQLRDALAWARRWTRGTSILIGDLNIRDKAWDPDARTTLKSATLLEWCEENNFAVQAPPGPTFVGRSGQSVVDLAVTRNLAATHTRVVRGEYEAHTDHRMAVFKLAPHFAVPRLRVPDETWLDEDFLNEVRQRYAESLPAVTQHAAAATTAEELDAAVDEWQAALLCPWRKFIYKKPPRFRRGWTREMDALASERSQLRKRAKRGDAVAHRQAKLIDRQLQRARRKQGRSEERRKKAEARAPAASTTCTPATDLSSVSKAVRTLLNEETAPRPPPPGEYMDHLRGMLPVVEPLAVAKFELPPDFQQLIEKALSKLDPATTGGPDAILPRILKLGPEPVAAAAAAVWAAVGRIGHVPTNLSEGRVTPVYKKKGDPRDVENHRPITVLNVLRRVICAAVDLWLRHAIDLHPQQWGFQYETGTQHALAFAEASLDRGYKFRAVLDLSAAYDLAPRRSIVELLRRRGVDPDLVNMIQCILSPGQVHVTGAPEDSMEVTAGVPQGDPLSPMLFNVLMDELLKAVDEQLGGGKPHASCYADDVQTSGRTRDELQQVLDVATEWAAKYGMRWNVRKSAEVTDAAPSAPEPPVQSSAAPTSATTRPPAPDPAPAPVPLSLAGQPLPQVLHASYLGIDIDARGATAAGTTKRIGSAHATMRRISASRALRELNLSQRMYVVRTHVLSQCDYALPVTPLPNSLQLAAESLEQTACQWALGTAVESARGPGNTERARKLLRLPPLRLRRRLAAMRLAHRAMRTVASRDRRGHKQQRARTILSSNTLLRAAGRLPRSNQHLAPLRRAALKAEWEKVTPTRRPIPDGERMPPALLGLPRGPQRVAAQFYMHNLPPTSWRLIPEDIRERVRALLLKEKLTEAQLKILTDNLSIIARAHAARRANAQQTPAPQRRALTQ